ncbi:MAG: hypothetical protein HZB22_06870 [Deltaproteobacteria bacterium]|nr:hypothetical protein [Deltaproteobacteria bacterium]
MKRCFSCGKAVDISGRPGRGEVCLHCGADLNMHSERIPRSLLRGQASE